MSEQLPRVWFDNSQSKTILLTNSFVSVLAGTLGEVVVWSLFLPRLGTGKEEVRSFGMEHSL